MQPIPQQVVDALQTLSPIEQQEVLDFVEFLKSKHQMNQQEQAEKSEEAFLEAAREYIGCLEGGSPDLSTNKAYMEGLGQK